MVGTPGRSGGNRTPGVDAQPVDGLPQMPSGKSKRFQAIWKALMGQLYLPALRKVDTHQLTSLVEMLELRDAISTALADDFDPTYLRLYDKYVTTIGRLSAQFGLSPIDRQRMKLEPDKSEQDDFEKWMNS